MPCTDCNSSAPKTIAITYTSPSGCENSDCTPVSSACVYYKGPNLSCSGIETDDSLELSLQKIDELLCQAAGDYSTYNFHCIDDAGAITTEAGFVSAITDYVCTLNQALEDFTGITFVDYQSSVSDRFTALEGPSLTCAASGVTAADSLSTLLSKYCTKFAALNTAIDLSSVTWNTCFTVTTAPTTIAAGFSLLADQICQIKSSGTTLPTFNNTATCLDTPGATDSLSSTVGKIISRLCQVPTLQNDNLSSSCISIPAADTDLETLLQAMLDKLDTLSQNLYTFDGTDFSVSATDAGNTCAGKTVALAIPAVQDRFVAVNADDASPGTLVDKLVIVGGTADAITNPGKLTITVTGADDRKVKANSADDAPGYLDEKLDGQSGNGILLSTAYNPTTKKVDLIPAVDAVDLLDVLFSYLESNPSSALKTRLCQIISTCPSDTGSCLQYTVANATGSAVYVSWLDCETATTVGMFLADGSSTTICCKAGSIVASGCTITLLGGCAGGDDGVLTGSLTTSTSTSTSSTSTSSTSSTSTTLGT